MRLPLTLALALVVAAPAAAQDDAPAHRITIVPPKPAPKPATVVKRPALILLRPTQARTSPTDPLAARSASVVDRASQCRAQCGEARYICSVDDGGECDSRWTQCTVGCGGSSYPFPSSAYVPLGR